MQATLNDELDLAQMRPRAAEAEAELRERAEEVAMLRAACGAKRGVAAGCVDAALGHFHEAFRNASSLDATAGPFEVQRLACVLGYLLQRQQLRQRLLEALPDEEAIAGTQGSLVAATSWHVTMKLEHDAPSDATSESVFAPSAGASRHNVFVQDSAIALSAAALHADDSGKVSPRRQGNTASVPARAGGASRPASSDADAELSIQRRAPAKAALHSQGPSARVRLDSTDGRMPAAARAETAGPRRLQEVAESSGLYAGVQGSSGAADFADAAPVDKALLERLPALVDEALRAELWERFDKVWEDAHLDGMV